MTSASRPLVAFVSDAQEYAGAEHYMIVIVEALRDRYEFVVVHGEDASDETRAKAVAGGAKTVPVAGLRRRPAPTATVRMWRCLRDLQPAIVHVNASDQGGGGAGGAGEIPKRADQIQSLNCGFRIAESIGKLLGAGHCQSAIDNPQFGGVAVVWSHVIFFTISQRCCHGH